jgi:hypothetical protein
MEVMTPEVGRNVAEFIRQVKAFQHVRATGRLPQPLAACKATLKPGPDWQVKSGKCGSRSRLSDKYDLPDASIQEGLPPIQGSPSQ